MGLTAALGAALLVLGVPRTIAAWEALAAEPALEKLQVGRKRASDAELADAVDGLERSVAWIPSARRFADLAFLEVEQAIRLPLEDPKRTVLLASAEQHVIKSLVANPADGYAWMRLAIIRELTGAPPRQIAVALAQSLDVAPNVRQLWIPRATMLMTYSSHLTAEELPAWRSQLRNIWTYGRAVRLPLLQTAIRLGQVETVSWGIGDDPPAQEEFEKLRDILLKYRVLGR